PQVRWRSHRARLAGSSEYAQCACRVEDSLRRGAWKGRKLLSLSLGRPVDRCARCVSRTDPRLTVVTGRCRQIRHPLTDGWAVERAPYNPGEVGLAIGLLNDDRTWLQRLHIRNVATD